MRLLQLIVVCFSIHFPTLLRGDIEANDGTCACGGKRDSVLGSAIINNSDVQQNQNHDHDHDIESDIFTEDSLRDGNAVKGGDNLHSARTTQRSKPTEESNQKMNMDNMVFIEGGTFFMGSDDRIMPSDGEGPRRIVTLHDFMMDRCVVNIILPNRNLILFDASVLYCTVQCCTVLCCAVLCCTVLCCAMLYCG